MDSLNKSAPKRRRYAALWGCFLLLNKRKGKTMEKKAYLKSGVLYDCFNKVRMALKNSISASEHAQTYVGEHGESYAEPEFSGKYIDISVKSYLDYHDEKMLENAKEVVGSVIANMRPDGYIGGLERGKEFFNFSVWNQAFTIHGLLAFYRATGDERALKCAERSADYVMNYFINEGNDILNSINCGTQHISILYMLCGIYEITKEEKYKDYIFFIVNSIKNSDLNFFDFESILELRSRKGIETLVILLGILKYGEIFGDEQALKSTEKYWEQLTNGQIRNTGNGTVEELWTEGGNAAMLLGADEKPNENCVAVGYIELSLALFYKNQSAKYLDAIDKSLYNHILSAISPDGTDFAYYQPNYGKKVRATESGSYKCCRYRGITLFTYMEDMLYYENENCIIPMIYASSMYESGNIKIAQETNYPYDGNVKISADVLGEREMLIKLRVPQGYSAQLRVNGKETEAKVESGYITVCLEKKSHTDIELTLETTVRAQSGIIDGKEYASFEYGTVLLAMIDYDGETLIDKSFTPLKTDKKFGGALTFKAKGIKNGESVDIFLTDYASADNYAVWIPAE